MQSVLPKISECLIAPPPQTLICPAHLQDYAEAFTGHNGHNKLYLFIPNEQLIEKGSFDCQGTVIWNNLPPLFTLDDKKN